MTTQDQKDEALKAYRAINDSAWKAYRAINDPAGKAYEAINDPALKVYEAISIPALEVYEAKMKEIEATEDIIEINDMTYTERRKATIDKFINIDSIDDLREVEAGLDEFAKYILAEERARVVGIINEPMNFDSKTSETVRDEIVKILNHERQRISFSLDKEIIK